MSSRTNGYPPSPPWGISTANSLQSPTPDYMPGPRADVTGSVFQKVKAWCGATSPGLSTLLWGSVGPRTFLPARPAPVMAGQHVPLLLGFCTDLGHEELSPCNAGPTDSLMLKHTYSQHWNLTTSHCPRGGAHPTGEKHWPSRAVRPVTRPSAR